MENFIFCAVLALYFHKIFLIKMDLSSREKYKSGYK